VLSSAAYRQAIAAGTDMRLVIGHPAARRVFELNGIDTRHQHLPGPSRRTVRDLISLACRRRECSQRPPGQRATAIGSAAGLFSGLSPG